MLTKTNISTLRRQWFAARFPRTDGARSYNVARHLGVGEKAGASLQCAGSGNDLLRMRRTLLALLTVGMVAYFGLGCSPRAKKERHLKQADHYFDAGQYDKAEIEYLNVLRAESLNLAAIRRLGIIAYEQGRFSRAYPLLAKARELDPTNLEVRSKLAVFLASVGKAKEAREEANFVLDRLPQDEEAMLVLAQTAVTTKDIDDTRQRLQKIGQQPGELASVQLASGLLSFRQQDIKSAESAFRRALTLDPKSSAAHAAIANLYWAQNDLKQAGEMFKMASDLSPIRSTRRMAYADFKIKTEDLEAAKRNLDETVRKAPDYLPALIRLAQIALAERRYDECGALVSKLLSRDGDNFDVLLLSGRLKLAKGQIPAAIADLERLADRFARAPQLMYQLAVAYILSQDFTKATSSLSRAITLDPNFAEAILLLAKINIQRGGAPSAIASLTRLAKERPQLVQAQLLLADAHRAQGSLDAALAIYRRLQQQQPKNPEVPLLIGLVLLQQKKNEEARTAFEQALGLAPDYLAALELLVDLDIADKQYASAFQRVQKELDKNPKAAPLQLLLAKIHLAKKETAQAETALLKAIETDPNLGAAYLVLARIYIESNRYQPALDRLQSALTRNPKDVGALLLMAVIYGELKNTTAARDAYEKVLTIDPRHSAALNNLAYLYSEHFGDLDKAYDMARRARDFLPLNPSAADTLGWVLYRRGDYPRALSLLQESAEKMPAHAEVQFHLGMTYYMMGQEEPARLALQRALQSNKDFPGKEEAVWRLSVLTIDPKTASPEVVANLEKKAREQVADPVVQGRLAVIYERDGLFEKAAPAYQSALKQNPHNIALMIRLARLYSTRLKNPQKALELAKEAHNQAPEDPEASHTLGQLAFEERDYKWASSLLQESVRKLANDPEVAYDYAWSEYSLGRVASAETAMRRALQINPGFAHAEAAERFLAVIVLSRDPSKAVTGGAEVQKILQADPDYVPALINVALFQEQQGNPTAARTTYEKVLKRYPFFGPALRQLAILQGATPADDKAAYDLAVRAREAYPQDTDVAKALGILAFRRGEHARAAQLLQESAAKRDKDAELFFYLGMAQYQLKQATASGGSLRRALSLNLNSPLAEEARQVLAKLN
jgi:tetratricopeptide (TPR) repeat protein